MKDGKCTGPEAGLNFVCSRNGKKAGAAKRRQGWETRLEGCCLSGERSNLNFTPSWAATARFWEKEPQRLIRDITRGAENGRTYRGKAGSWRSGDKATAESWWERAWGVVGGEQKQPAGLGNAGRPSVGPPLPTPSLPPLFPFLLYLQGQLKHQCFHKPFLTTSEGVSHLQPHPTPCPKIKIPSQWVNKDRGLKKPISKLSAHKHQSHTSQSHFGCDVLTFL